MYYESIEGQDNEERAELGRKACRTHGFFVCGSCDVPMARPSPSHAYMLCPLCGTGTDAWFPDLRHKYVEVEDREARIAKYEGYELRWEADGTRQVYLEGEK